MQLEWRLGRSGSESLQMMAHDLRTFAFRIPASALFTCSIRCSYNATRSLTSCSDITTWHVTPCSVKHVQPKIISNTRWHATEFLRAYRNVEYTLFSTAHVSLRDFPLSSEFRTRIHASAHGLRSWSLNQSALVLGSKNHSIPVLKQIVSSHKGREDWEGGCCLSLIFIFFTELFVVHKLFESVLEMRILQ